MGRSAGLTLTLIALLLGAGCGVSDCSSPGGTGADCEVAVTYGDRTYWRVGNVKQPAPLPSIGTGEVSECDDSSYPGECAGPMRGIYFSGTGAEATLVRLGGVDPQQAIGWQQPRARVVVLVSDDVSADQRERILARIRGD